MIVNIPSLSGLPGISGPPDWLNPPPTGSYQLDDVHWFASSERTFGGGASKSGSLRATQAVVAGQQYIYLSFRAAFAPGLSDQFDSVFIGLKKHGVANPKAMVIQLDVHGAAVGGTFTPSGPPSANPPSSIANLKIWTRVSPATSWTLVATTKAGAPAWIDMNARAWLQSASDVPTDQNNRWAIELRIPVTTAMDIIDPGGPNLGTDFDMWYFIRGTLPSVPDLAVIIGESGDSATPTALEDINDGKFPAPDVTPSHFWDEFQLTSGPGATGGVTIFGNGYNDIVVQNSLGEGTLIANGQNNTFVARPRNYSGVAIPAGNINATFRIANWGSIADPNAPWDYVTGNSALVPVNSAPPDIAPLPPGSNPPATNNQLSLLVPNLTLPSGKSLHQCIFVTLSGTNLIFLSNSAFKNMDFDHGSLLEREAEINLVGLTPFSQQPRDVYLAIEKVNMQSNTPAGTNEGLFLESSMSRLVALGGPLAEKLKTAQAILSDAGALRSLARLDGRNERLNTFVKILSDVGLTENDLDRLFPTFRVHPYYDTGERVSGSDGKTHPVLRAQSSFGIYAYHEGGLDGWQTSIQGAQRIADNLYLLAVPNNGTAKVTVRVQGVGPGEQRIPEDPITPPADGTQGKGCLWWLLYIINLITRFIQSLLGKTKP